MPDYEPHVFNQASVERDLSIDEADDSEFYRVLERLPSGPTAADMDWIRAHPAMCRGARTGRTVVITAAEIHDASSRAAVNALSFFANNEKDFYRQVSHVEQVSEVTEVEDESIECIEDILRRLGDS